MPDDTTNPGEEDEEDALLKRFPAMPHASHDAPAPPKIVVDLPPHPDRPKPGANDGGGIRNSALAYQAASSFIAPIIILALLGWFLDQRFHTGGLLIIALFILGFIVGVVSLLRIVNQMDSDPGKR